MVGLKKKSKRITTKRRVKIEKKVKEHNRKKKKEARNTSRKGKKKDPGVPNSLPFKQMILEEAELHKQKRDEEREKQRQQQKKEREKLMNKQRNLEELVNDANKRQQEFEKKKASQEKNALSEKQKKPPENSLKAYFREFRKVVDTADVVLEILDARDPLGSRCQALEAEVLSSGTTKKLVLVLNKIDLVPKENVEAWLTYLRNEFPTVAFKASTQMQNDHLSQRKASLASASADLIKSSHCLGADVLMKLLGNYCRNQNVRTSIRVGVVGFPNTGKSSIINSLKRSRTCSVGATPGVTKTMQEVILDKHIRLLDSPGVVMATQQSETAAVLRNVVRLEELDDPVPAVDAILKRCSKAQMMLHYNLTDFKNVDEFLALLATRRGQLRKGGVPDTKKAGRAVLKDWTSGRITYYTHPPEQHQLPIHISASIVSEMSKSFDIESLLTDESNILKGLAPTKSSHMLVDSVGPLPVIVEESDLPEDGCSETKKENDPEEEESGEKMVDDDEDDDEKNNLEEMGKVTVSLPSSRTEKASKVEPTLGVKRKRADTSQPSGSGLNSDNTQSNKVRKKAFKKMKKDRKRADVVSEKLSSALDSAFGVGLGDDSGDDYDFSTDFT